MAPILSRSLVTSSLVSLPLINPNKAFNIRNTFVPLNTLNKALSCSRLREKFEYQVELDLIVHSLYSHKKVFLRELVSNASDALDKLRFLSVAEPSLLEDSSELEIHIKPDSDNGTITIMIGITKEKLIDCLGTIAQSGISKFLKALKGNSFENKDLRAYNGLIGQFGVGFYYAFLVAEKVVVSTKSPKSNKQYVWEAIAHSSSYVIR
uniref:Histidine kinase/HSP90-like ATPase domain-containing protein n=1 Tax=Gossypium raimondii TaxID=29730 RepID=A0A0D2SPM9_GOSRA|nr:hypothetical protein B456_006G000500 [Gossypium raimondii]